MARIRSIKPEFFLDDELAELGALSVILFAGLWTQADREGRLQDRPRRLKAALMPYYDCDVDALLDGLSPGFIVRYEVDGERYIQVVNFGRHQCPNSKEPPSVIPPPPAGTCEHDAVTVQEQCEHSASTSLKGKEGKGREREAHTPARVCTDLLQAEYGTFPTPKQGERIRILADRYDDAPKRIEWGIDRAKAAGKLNIGYALACAEGASVQELSGASDDSDLLDRMELA